MSCGGDVPFNAGPATAAPCMPIGAARPGAAGKRCFDADAPKVTAAEVDEWADFMQKEFGAQRIVGLLTPSELETYEPGALERLSARFDRGGGGSGGWTNVDVKGGGAEALRKVLDAIDAGVSAGERVVVHCWGGGGRTGNALGGWLAARGGGGCDAEAAASAVSAFAAEKGYKRRADAAGVQAYVDADSAANAFAKKEEAT